MLYVTYLVFNFSDTDLSQSSTSLLERVNWYLVFYESHKLFIDQFQKLSII